MDDVSEIAARLTKAHVLRFLDDDVIAVFEDILDQEDLDRENCAAMFSHDLCGAEHCRWSGCIVDKLKRAKQVRARVEETRNG